MANLDRRHALGLAAVAAASPVLAGCGDNSASSSSSAQSSQSVPDGPLVATTDVPVGGGVIVAGAQLVVTQPTAGEFKAFSSICTHQSCPITKVADGSIDCTCHFSKFSIEDGSVLDGPAEKPLPEKKITVSGDSITLG